MTQSHSLKWYYNNKEKSLKTKAAWRETNSAYYEKYRKSQRSREHRRRESSRRRSRRKGNLEHNLDYQLVLVNDPCSYCGKSMEHIDHIDSLHQGGYDEWTNMTASCARCNRKKFTSKLLTFLLKGVDCFGTISQPEVPDMPS